MTRPRVISEETKAEARKLAREGWSHSRIAKHFGIGVSTVHFICYGIVKDGEKPANLTPAPYARGYRWTNTKWH